MYGCESWTVKKAERWRMDAFELRCWRRLLRVPWTARRSNQSILKGISPGISLEGMMLKLKFQYFGHLMWRVDSLEKILMLGKVEGGGEGDNREWDGWMASPTQWTRVWVNSGSWWWTGKPGVLQFMGSQRVRHDWASELNWTRNQEKFWVQMERSGMRQRARLHKGDYKYTGDMGVNKSIRDVDTRWPLFNTLPQAWVLKFKLWTPQREQANFHFIICPLSMNRLLLL